MMTLPVLLISHGFQPSYEKAFTNALAFHRTDITLAASIRTEFDQLDPKVKPVRLMNSVDPNRTLGEKILAKICYLSRLTKLLAVHRRGVVHLIGIFLTSSMLLGIIELVAYRLMSKKLLMTVHNLLPHDRHTWLNRHSAWIAYRIPHKLVVHTDKMQDDLIQNWGIEPNRIIVMEHGVDIIPTTQTNRKLGGSTDLKLLMFGGVARYKGVDMAISALTRIDDFPVKLTIAGACRDPQYESLLRELMNRIQYHRIEWRNEYVPETQVQTIFEEMDAVLLPYRHIDQSGVLFTAFRFGLPVIAFDVGSFSRYINPHVGIVVKENNSESLTVGIRKFRMHSSHFDREVIKSYASNFLWKDTIKPILEQYS